MKIAILGGSFNPVHLGHLFLADSVLSNGYDRIIIVPAFQSPFKQDVDAASPKDRLEMLYASITGDPRLSVDDCEIQREGISYTIDTIMEIKEKYKPHAKPGLILGDDLVETFHLWKNASFVAQETDIILARRLAQDLSTGQKEFPFPHHRLNNEVMDISSRMVREKILKGENWRYLIPMGARWIIEDRKLYGLKRSLMMNTGHETIAFFEDYIRRSMGPSRFIHCRNTAVLARDLCLRYNMDPMAGYLAGIVHDICKFMEDDELIRLALCDGKGMSALEKTKPSLLHGRAAAIYLQEHYSIKDKEILDAVSSHVTGGMGMGALAKVIYIADKTEASRDWVAPRFREMCRNADLDELFTAVLEDNVSFLHTQRKDIAEGTQRLLAAMAKKSAARLAKGKS